EPVVFGYVIRHSTDVFFQLGDQLALSIANDYAVGCRPRIPARGAIDIGSMSGRSDLRLRRRFRKERCAGRTRRFWAGWHQEWWEAEEAARSDPLAGSGKGIGSRVYKIKPQDSQ